MAPVTWSGTSGHMQVGIEIWTDAYDTNTPSINVYVRVWARSIAWGYNDDMVVYLRGSVAGDYGFRMTSGSGQTAEYAVGLYTIPSQGQSYGGGPTYQFTVSLGGAADGSSPALTVNWTLPARPPNVPTAPGTSVSSIADTAATINVTAADGRGSAVNAYQVRVQRNSDGAIVYDVVGSGTKRVTGLVRATAYVYFARARNGVGWGSWSAAKGFTTLPTSPSAPRSLQATGNPGPTDVPLSWLASADNGGRPVSSHQVAAYTNSAMTALALTKTVGGTTLATTLEGLQPGQDYWIRVRASNSEGTSGWSNAVTASTLARNKVKVAEDDWRPFRLWVKRPSGWVRARLWKKAPDGTWVQ